MIHHAYHEPPNELAYLLITAEEGMDVGESDIVEYDPKHRDVRFGERFVIESKGNLCVVTIKDLEGVTTLIDRYTGCAVSISQPAVVLGEITQIIREYRF